MYDFEATASRHVQTIVAEKTLPPEQRQYLQRGAGGVAGGDKYTVDGLFIKFVHDDAGIYGADAFAQRAARHELKGAEAYRAAGVEGLETALMMLADHRGWRLMVMAALPLHAGSMVYGSQNQGDTIHTGDHEVAGMMKEAAARIGLAAHRLQPLHGPPVTLHAAIDVEVHHGANAGQFFVLDTARTLPPEEPSESAIGVHLRTDLMAFLSVKRFRSTKRGALLAEVRAQVGEGSVVVELAPEQFSAGASNLWLCFHPMAHANGAPVNEAATSLAAHTIHGDAFVVQRLGRPHLYNMLRKEFVQNKTLCPLPLSPDGFSYFGRLDQDDHNTRIRNATRLLRTKLVPAFAQQVAAGQQGNTAAEICDRMRESGINARYLSDVRLAIVTAEEHKDSAHHATLKLSQASQFIWTQLLTEICARALKGVLRDALRRVDPRGGMRAYQARAAAFMNQVVGDRFLAYGPCSPTQSRVSFCAARTLNATGQCLVTLSLWAEHV